jgi:hypothetical protein
MDLPSRAAVRREAVQTSGQLNQACERCGIGCHGLYLHADRTERLGAADVDGDPAIRSLGPVASSTSDACDADAVEKQQHAGVPLRRVRGVEGAGRLFSTPSRPALRAPAATPWSPGSQLTSVRGRTPTVASGPWCKRATGVGSLEPARARRRTYARGRTSITHRARPRRDRRAVRVRS